MSDEAIARKAREEHGVVTELMQELLRILHHVPRNDRGDWLQELRSRFEHFRAHLVKSLAIEESGGFMSPARERRPTLARQIEKLRDEHRQILRICDDIHRNLKACESGDHLLLRDGRARIQNVLEQIAHHNEQEDLLVLSVFNTDIGSHD